MLRAAKGVETLLRLSWESICWLPRVFAQASARPEPPDWYAGDAHVHRGIGCGREHEKEMLTAAQLLEMMKPNNLAVISVLSDIGNGELKYVEKDLPLMTGKDNPVSTPDRILHWDAEWHYDPDGVTFARKVIGGHLILLGLKQGGQPFAHYTYPILDWAKKNGALVASPICSICRLPFTLLLTASSHSLDCCSPLEFPVETALGTSSFLMEDVHGSDSALEAYYKILNTGFRPGLVASTDYSCNYLEPLGTLLTYVQVPDGKLTYDKWVDGIAKGRTVVSRVGHNEFLDLKVNGASTPGDELNLPAKGQVKVRIEWTSLKQAIGRIELVQNGVVVASKTAAGRSGQARCLRDRGRCPPKWMARCPQDGLAERTPDAYGRGLYPGWWTADSRQRERR